MAISEATSSIQRVWFSGGIIPTAYTRFTGFAADLQDLQPTAAGRRAQRTERIRMEQNLVKPGAESAALCQLEAWAIRQSERTTCWCPLSIHNGIRSGFA